MDWTALLISISTPPQETASSDEVAHQLNVSHSMPPQESSTDEADTEKPVPVMVAPPHLVVR